MVFILQDEIVKQVMTMSINDVPIGGPLTTYSDKNGNPAVLSNRPGIQKYIWKYVEDLNHISYHLAETGGTPNG